MEPPLHSARILLVLWTIRAAWAGTSVAYAHPHADAITVTLYGLEVRITPDASCCGRCSEDRTPSRAGVMTCYCDEYCLVYRDCCLDYELQCTDLLLASGRLGREWADDRLLESVGNCSRDSVTPATAAETAPSNVSETGGDLRCTRTRQAEQAEYACQVEALWEPVVVARNSNRDLAGVFAHGDFAYALIQDCAAAGSWRAADAHDLCTKTSLPRSLGSLEDVRNLAPVTGPDGLHYRSVHCARCNDMEDGDLQSWQVRLNCPLEVLIVGLTDSSVSGCSFRSVAPPETFRGRASQPRLVPIEETTHLCGHFLSAQSQREYEAACRAYTLRTPCAKNPHCDGSCSCRPGPGEAHDPGPYLPISAVFDFTARRDVRYSLSGGPEVVVCDRGYEFFDPLLGACRGFHCPPGQATGPRATCVVLNSTSDRCLVPGFNSGNPRAVSEFQVDFSTVAKHISAAELLIMNCTQSLLNVSATEFDLCDCQAPPSPFDTNARVQCTVSFTAVSSLSFEETLSDLPTRIMSQPVCGPGILLEKLSVRNFNQQASLVDRCGRLGQVPIGYSLGIDYTKYEVNGSSFVVITADDDELTCAADDLRREVVFGLSANPKPPEELVYLCRTMLNCSMVILNSTEYTRLDNDTVRLASGVKLSRDEYILLSGDQAAVCRPGECRDCGRPYLLGDAVLSLVCLVISQLFLLLCLLSFCLLPELCTLPGKNLFCSILALFLTQLVFLLGPGSPLSRYTLSHEASCLAFAVSVHYLLLAFFFWTNVVSLHFARTFGFQLRMRTQRFRRAFGWYSLYGWGSPAAIAGAWLAVHRLLLTGEDSLVIYRHCLPYDMGAVLLVAAPVSILITANAVLFCLTVVGIRRTRQSTSMVMKEQRRLERLQTEVALCIKICVATGLTWTLIFILGSVDAEGFSHLFSVLVAAQGPLLFFCFAFTRRVRALWRARMAGLWAREPGAATSAAGTVSAPRTISQVAD